MADGDRTGNGPDDADLEARIEGIIQRVLARQPPAAAADTRGAGASGKLVLVG